jgi:tetratricopeptide (TPR) repeat protein
MAAGARAMRIGEILIAASLVDAKKLEMALDYAASKSIPVGGALRALKYVNDNDLKRSLDAQQAMDKGLKEEIAVKVLCSAHEHDRPFVDELRKMQSELGVDVISDSLLYWLNVPDSLESTRIGGLKMPEQQIAPRSPDKLVVQGDMFFEANQLLEAEQAYIGAKSSFENEYYPPKEKIVVVITKLANLYLATNRFEKAHKLYQRVVDMQTELHGAQSHAVVVALEDIADLYDLEDNKMDARGMYSRALDLLEKLPEDMIIAGRLLKKYSLCCGPQDGADRTRIGELAIDSGLLTAPQLEAALKLGKDTSQPLGAALRNQGVVDGQQVESLMFAQVLVKQGSLAPLALVRAIKLCAAYNIQLKHLAEAGRWVSDEMASDPLYKQLLAEQERLLITEGVLGPNDPEVAMQALAVADIHLARKDRLSAQILYQRAVVILEKTGSAERAPLVRAYDKLAQIFYQQSKFTEAQAVLLKSLELRRSIGRGDSAEAAKCLWLLGKLGMAQRNNSAALSYLLGAKKVFEKLGADQVPKQLIDEIASCNPN